MNIHISINLFTDLFIHLFSLHGFFLFLCSLILFIYQVFQLHNSTDLGLRILPALEFANRGECNNVWLVSIKPTNTFHILILVMC